MSTHMPTRQANDVLLPKQGDIRAVAVDATDGITPDPNAIVTSIASSASEATFSGAGLDGVIGVVAGEMSPPRNIVITTTAHADIDAVGAVVTGTNYLDETITETITLTDGGNASDAGAELFKTVVSVVIPAQSGTGGALEIGTGKLASLEEFMDEYVTMQSDVDLHITTEAAGTAITDPDATAVTGNARSAPHQKNQPIPARPNSATNAIKVKAGGTGTLWWWPSTGAG